MRISVIIPVYHAAATLDRCLESILAQSFGDYQVVLADDGSADGSLDIARRWAARDSRFQVCTGPYGGPGAARNRGLEMARGEYVLYMDADDRWSRRDLLEILDGWIQKQRADVYLFQMEKVTEDGTVLERYAKPPFEHADTVLPLSQVYQDLVRDGHTLAAAWNKCVRRELMTAHQIRFREDVLCEDIDWVLQLFSHVQTICLLNIRAYAYTQHRAVSRSTRPDAPNDLAAIVQDWGARTARGGIAHPEAVAGVVAFEYGVCMGSHHLLSPENRRLMRENVHLLDHGLDAKTILIRRFCGLFGYRLTCAAVRLYLAARRIW